jgi:hypothetical protein
MPSRKCRYCGRLSLQKEKEEEIFNLTPDQEAQHLVRQLLFQHEAQIHRKLERLQRQLAKTQSETAIVELAIRRNEEKSETPAQHVKSSEERWNLQD